MRKGRIDRTFGAKPGNIKQGAIDLAVERDYGELGYERTSAPPSQPTILDSKTQVQEADKTPIPLGS